MKILATAILPAVLLAAPIPAVLDGRAGVAHAAGSDSEDELIARGVKLRKEGDDQAARDLFRQAYERSRSPRAAGQLGLAEQALGRWEDAEVHLREALRSPGDPWVKKNYDLLSHDIHVVKNHVARIEILGQPDGAEVVVNGRVVGKLPLSGPVSASAGEVDIEARAPGYHREVRKLSVVGGQYQQIVVRLQKDEPVATRPATGGATTAGANASGDVAKAIDPATVKTAGAETAGARVGDNGSGPSGGGSGGGAAATDASSVTVHGVAKWSALGLAGAGLALGITSSLVRASNLDTFKTAHGGMCVEMAGRAVDLDGMPVQECQGPLDTYKSMRTWQIVGFVSAGVFAATWLTLLLTEPAPGSSSGQSVARRPALVCGPTGDLSGAACMLRL